MIIEILRLNPNITMKKMIRRQFVNALILASAIFTTSCNGQEEEGSNLGAQDSNSTHSDRCLELAREFRNLGDAAGKSVGAQDAYLAGYMTTYYVSRANILTYLSDMEQMLLAGRDLMGDDERALLNTSMASAYQGCELFTSNRIGLEKVFETGASTAAAKEVLLDSRKVHKELVEFCQERVRQLTEGISIEPRSMEFEEALVNLQVPENFKGQKNAFLEASQVYRQVAQNANGISVDYTPGKDGEERQRYNILKASPSLRAIMSQSYSDIFATLYLFRDIESMIVQVFAWKPEESESRLELLGIGVGQYYTLMKKAQVRATVGNEFLSSVSTPDEKEVINEYLQSFRLVEAVAKERVKQLLTTEGLSDHLDEGLLSALGNEGVLAE
ncbi:MAG: hypothetical protein H7A52_17015 [Akkermansiaceae bacterium]|nr:hypothetical protein [Akkermansiaceae bacterium]